MAIYANVLTSRQKVIDYIIHNHGNIIISGRDIIELIQRYIYRSLSAIDVRCSEILNDFLSRQLSRKSNKYNNFTCHLNYKSEMINLNPNKTNMYYSCNISELEISDNVDLYFEIFFCGDFPQYIFEIKINQCEKTLIVEDYFDDKCRTKNINLYDPYTNFWFDYEDPKIKELDWFKMLDFCIRVFSSRTSNIKNSNFCE